MPSSGSGPSRETALPRTRGPLEKGAPRAQISVHGPHPSAQLVSPHSAGPKVTLYFSFSVALVESWLVSEDLGEGVVRVAATGFCPGTTSTDRGRAGVSDAAFPAAAVP